MPINDLPLEVLRHTFLYLEPKSFLAASQTCKHWRQIALWRYTLIRHIDLFLYDYENRDEFFKFFLSQVTDSDATENIDKRDDDYSLDLASGELLNSLIQSSNEKVIETFTQLYNAFILKTTFTSLGCIAQLEDSNKISTKFTHDAKLVTFYRKLLQMQLLGRSLIPLYAMEIPAAFFSSTNPRQLNSAASNENLHPGNSQVVECVCFSLDGCYMLTVTRGVDNYHFLYIHQLYYDPHSNSGLASKTSYSTTQPFTPRLIHYYCWNNDRTVDQVVLSTDNRYLGISFNVGYAEVHDLFVSDSNRGQGKCNSRFPLNLGETSTNSSKENEDYFLYNNKEVISTTTTSKNTTTYITMSRIYPIETKVLFSRQYPSAINYLAISKNGEVLFLRSQRLGGIIIVNLSTGEEIDIPHYRLDLSMSLQYNDKVLMMSGWNETIIFGKATPDSKVNPSSDKKQEDDEECMLWKYFSYHLRNNISSYVPLERAIALPKTNAYLGFDCSEIGGVNVKIILDEDELIGFKSLETVTERGVLDNDDDYSSEEEDDKNEEREEDESTNSQNNCDQLPNAQLQALPIEQNGQNDSSSVSNIDTENVVEGIEDADEQDIDDEEDDDEEDEDEDPNKRPEFPIFKRTSIALTDLTYCFTMDASRFAILRHNKIYLFHLNDSTISDAFKAGYLPHRIIHVNFASQISCTENETDTQQQIAIRKFMFINRNQLLLMTEKHLIVYDLSRNPGQISEHRKLQNKFTQRYSIDEQMMIYKK